MRPYTIAPDTHAKMMINCDCNLSKIAENGEVTKGFKKVDSIATLNASQVFPKRVIREASRKEGNGKLPTWLAFNIHYSSDKQKSGDFFFDLVYAGVTASANFSARAPVRFFLGCLAPMVR